MKYMKLQNAGKCSFDCTVQRSAWFPVNGLLYTIGCTLLCEIDTFITMPS